MFAFALFALLFSLGTAGLYGAEKIVSDMNQKVNSQVPEDQREVDTIDQEILSALGERIREYELKIKKSDGSEDSHKKDLEQERQELFTKYIEILRRRIQRVLDHPMAHEEEKAKLKEFVKTLQDIEKELIEGGLESF
jgi:DNA replication initiation complex subunit (GINS family)